MYSEFFQKFAKKYVNDVRSGGPTSGTYQKLNEFDLWPFGTKYCHCSLIYYPYFMLSWCLGQHKRTQLSNNYCTLAGGRGSAPPQTDIAHTEA